MLTFCYSGGILLVTRKLEGRTQKIGLIITLTPFIALVFDVIENINLLLMLANDSFIRSGSPFIASLCATIKFSIIFLGWAFLLYGLIVLIGKKFRENEIGK